MLGEREMSLGAMVHKVDWELELESCLFNIFSIVVYQNRKIKFAEQVSKGVVSLENLP